MTRYTLPNPEGVNRFANVTPSNTTLLEGWQFLLVVVEGDVELGSVNGVDNTTAVAFTAGQMIPFNAGYVRTNTTATLWAMGG